MTPLPLLIGPTAAIERVNTLFSGALTIKTTFRPQGFRELTLFICVFLSSENYCNVLKIWKTGYGHLSIWHLARLGG